MPDFDEGNLPDETPTEIVGPAMDERREKRKAELQAELVEAREKWKALAGEPPEPEPETFWVEILFKRGMVRTFRVTEFEWDEEYDCWSWKQEQARPGDMMLQHLDDDEIAMIQTWKDRED